MRLGGKTQNVHFFGRIKGCRNQVIWHVLPFEKLEGTNVGGDKGVFGIDDHSKLSREETKT